MAPLQAIGSERWNGRTHGPLAALVRLARALSHRGARETRIERVEAPAKRERERIEIARLTGSFHEQGSDPAEVAADINRRARFTY